MAGEIKHLSQDNFKSEVLESKVPVLVDFWAPWCAPCKMAEPVLEELNEEYKDLRIMKVNVDDEPQLASEYGVMSIPTVILFKDGKIVDQMVGFAGKAGYLRLLAKLEGGNRD